MKRDSKKSSDQSRGAVGFDAYYLQLWGERWPTLRSALLSEAAKFKFENPFARSTDVVSPTSALRPIYELDPASVLVARLIGARPGERVLDMCAAPGGKSLVQIFDAESPPTTTAASADPTADHIAERTEWWLNDLSPDRVFRLKKVMAEHLPDSVYRHLRVSAFDASQFGLHKAAFFDRILLDAPCSGERHMLENEKALADWGPQRSKGLASRQYSLLCSAELALRPGGRLVYSTCTISNLENDDVIARFFERRARKKLPASLRVLSLDEILGDQALSTWVRSQRLELEPTKHGFYILPDRSFAAGPMYFSVLEKI